MPEIQTVSTLFLRTSMTTLIPDDFPEAVDLARGLHSRDGAGLFSVLLSTVTASSLVSSVHAPLFLHAQALLASTIQFDDAAAIATDAILAQLSKLIATPVGMLIWRS